MTSPSNTSVTIEKMVKLIVKSQMEQVHKMKKADLMILVEDLMYDVIRELDDFTIRNLYQEL